MKKLLALLLVALLCFSMIACSSGDDKAKDADDKKTEAADVEENEDTKENEDADVEENEDADVEEDTDAEDAVTEQDTIDAYYAAVEATMLNYLASEGQEVEEGLCIICQAENDNEDKLICSTCLSAEACGTCGETLEAPACVFCLTCIEEIEAALAEEGEGAEDSEDAVTEQDAADAYYASVEATMYNYMVYSGTEPVDGVCVACDAENDNAEAGMIICSSCIALEDCGVCGEALEAPECVLCLDCIEQIEVSLAE